MNKIRDILIWIIKIRWIYKKCNKRAFVTKPIHQSIHFWHTSSKVKMREEYFDRHSPVRDEYQIRTLSNRSIGAYNINCAERLHYYEHFTRNFWWISRDANFTLDGKNCEKIQSDCHSRPVTRVSRNSLWFEIFGNDIAILEASKLTNRDS